MEIHEGYSIQEKLEILSDAAKYDVACTSSGSSRSAKAGRLGSTEGSGICHAFAADGRCISLLKILMSNECVYDCKYCVNRRSRDTKRTTFTPEEICTLTTEFYRRNYIEGLFLSSGVVISPDHTMELMYETLYELRYRYGFYGYIHVKCIPGADRTLIEKIGFLADRMSLNLELPTKEGLSKLAPSKKEENILGPIMHIRSGIEADMHYGRSAYQTTRRYIGFRQSDAALAETNIALLWENAVPKEQLPGGIRGNMPNGTAASGSSGTVSGLPEKKFWLPDAVHAEDRKWLAGGKLSHFVPAGQSTQMIIGATKETDYDIVTKAELMYKHYDLKRVFYSAFINTTADPLLPETPDGPPLLREHRLYQADFLLRYYGFEANELLSPTRPDLHLLMDPKCGWAVRHLEYFPVEVMKADYALLLRVPGIGVKSAERIVKARRNGFLTFDSLKKMGVVLKRAHYFILCCGKQLFPTKIEERSITRSLVSLDREKDWFSARKNDYRQLDLFSDLGMKVSGE